MFVIFITMNFHVKGLPSRYLISLPQKQIWVCAFDVLGTPLTLLCLILEVSGKCFWLAVVFLACCCGCSGLPPLDICLSAYLFGSNTWQESEAKYSRMMLSVGMAPWPQLQGWLQLIIESWSLSWKETLKVICSNYSAVDRVMYREIRLPRAPSILTLNVTMDRVSSTSLGKLFQCILSKTHIPIL